PGVQETYPGTGTRSGSELGWNSACRGASLPGASTFQSALFMGESQFFSHENNGARARARARARYVLCAVFSPGRSYFREAEDVSLSCQRPSRRSGSDGQWHGSGRHAEESDSARQCSFDRRHCRRSFTDWLAAYAASEKSGARIPSRKSVAAVVG